MSKTIFILAFVLGFISTQAQQSSPLYNKSFTYKTLSAYQKKLFDTFLNSEIPPGVKAETTLTDHASLRSKTRVAQALLFRNAPGDIEQAKVILKWILQNQYQDETSELYGIWKTSVLNDRFDKNWREFIGCDLIIIRQKYRHLLPADLLKDIDTGLLHAAKGAFKRNVGADYTNISIMSAFLMEYTGTVLGIDYLQKAGVAKAQAIFRLYQAHKTFSEYNSPTYYGVNLIGLALWREMSFSKELREMAHSLEKDFWQEIVLFYNPVLKNMAGPYFRGYGMEMTRYLSITGIWMALAVDNEALAPIPAGIGRKYGEMSNLSTIFHLGLSIPVAALQSMKAKSFPVYINRDVPNNYTGDSIKAVSAAIYKNWMMGAMWGNKRIWEQIKTGTIHWKNNSGATGWLAIQGDGHTNLKTTRTTMQIFSSSPEGHQLEVLVYSPATRPDHFMKQNWDLSGFAMQVKTSLKVLNIEKTDPKTAEKKYAIADDVPFFYKITYEVPAMQNLTKPIIEITPGK